MRGATRGARLSSAWRVLRERGVVAVACGSLVLAAVASLALTRRGSGKPAESARLPIVSGPLRLGRAAASARRKLGAHPGDWLLSSDKIRLAVGADAGGVERQLRYGAVVDLAAPGGEAEKALDVRAYVELGGRALTLRVDGVEPRAVPEPVLRVKQSSREGPLALETEFRVSAGQPWVELRTTVHNTGRQPLRALRVGDRVRWPGAPVFAPRLGFVKAPQQAMVPWIARVGRDYTQALSYPSGSFEAWFSFDRIGQSEQRTLLPAVELQPGEQYTYVRHLIALPGGLEDAAEHAWRLAGEPLGRVVGNLLPIPAWATVHALHPDGKPVLAARSNAAGRVELPLPEGEYQLSLDAPGGYDKQMRVKISAGQDVEATLMPPSAARLRYSVTDDSGAPLAARYVVRGVAPTPDPNFGPAERAEGSGNVFYTRTGEGFVELPAGRYRVTVTHGMEYTISDQELTLTVDEITTLRSALERVVDTAGWLACDFHLHAAPSHDSAVLLDDRVVSLLAEGVEFAVATDHNHVTDYRPVVERLDSRELVATTPGVEITTRTWGHFIAFPYPLTAPLPPYSGVEPAQIFATTRRHAPEAVLQVNHPRMPGLGYFNRGELNAVTGRAAGEGFSFDFDTLEVVNGFELGQPDVVAKNIREWFDLLNAGRRYTAVGNSDSHRLFFQWAGYPRTYVRLPDDHPSRAKAEPIATALRRGQAIVSNGPFVDVRLEGSAGPGDLLTAEHDTVTVEVVVRAPNWVDVRRAELVVNGRIVQTAEARGTDPAARLQWQTSLRLEQDSWVVVMVRGDVVLEHVLPKTNVLPFAFTNPIFVDVDRDGLFTAPFSADAGAGEPPRGTRGQSSR